MCGMISLDGVAGMRSWRGLLGATMLAMLVALTPARPAKAETDAAHFIVLIDDSYDMRRFRPRILTHLPELLYGRIAGVPKIRLGIDRISLGYYGVSARGRGEGGPTPHHPCHDRPGNSILPENIIDWVDGVESSSSRGNFESLLADSLSMDCRMHHGWSPIAIAETLALPAANPRLPAEQRISKVYLINVTNEAFNVEGQEIASFRSRQIVTGDDVAEDVARRVAMLFQRRVEKNWEIQVTASEKVLAGAERAPRSQDPLIMRVTGMLPAAGDLAALVNAPSEVRINRFAVSPDTIRLAPEGDGLLNIRQSDRVAPTALTWQRKDSAAPWPAGSKPVNLEGKHSLSPCLGVCAPKDGALAVSILGVLGIPAAIPAGTTPSDPALIEITGEYNFLAPSIYDHLRVTTPPRGVRLNPASAPPLPAGNGAGALLAPSLFAALVMDDQRLTDTWRPEDGSSIGLSQEQARSRLLALRDMRQIQAQLILVLLTLAVLASALWYLYRRHYHRPFQPILVWRGVEGLTIDFNTDRATPVLAGTVVVSNTASVPFFGRLLGNGAQPQCPVRLKLRLADPTPSGIHLAGSDALLGFASVEATRHHIMPSVEKLASDGTTCDLFLDPRLVADFEPLETPSTVVVTLTGTIDMLYRNGEVVRAELALPLILSPEEARSPLIELVNTVDHVEFGTAPNGEPLIRPLGTYRLTSQSHHRLFAKPFRGHYGLACHHRTLPLADGAIRLTASDAQVNPGQNVDISVVLACDGKIVKNPEQEFEPYAFRLLGEAASGSELDRHEFRLSRDATQPDADIRLVEGETAWHLSFDQAGTPRRIESCHIGLSTPEAIEGGRMMMPARPLRFAADTPVAEMLTVEFRNVARNGQGFLQISVTPQLNLADAARLAMEMADGSALNDLIQIHDGSPQGAPSTFEVAADGSVVVRHIRIDTTNIRMIHGAVIPENEATLVVDIRTRVVDRDHRPLTEFREVTIAIPLAVEQLPEPNWLCIDFGTSAIAAAIGEGSTVAVLDLQNAQERVTTTDGSSVLVSLAAEDARNSERGSCFLPSFVACNADLRALMPRTSDSTMRKGFPRYPQPSLRPGEPDFLTLPATSDEITHNSERVVHSLKSWLGVGADDILLGTEMEIEDEGIRKTVSRLPVDRTVESAFAALAEAYLKPLKVRAGRVVVTHPNTFTTHHVQRLRSVVFKALSSRMGIPLADRIHMVSESDAAAFYYFTTFRDNLDPPVGTETLLVYDFGAGTLDISVVRITWDPDGTGAPQAWKVLHRLGVPVAGNHLDSLLARLVDQVLRDPMVLPPDRFSYQFPVVADSLSEHRREHRAAIIRLWMAIREAKHANGGWKGDTPLVISLCKTLGHMGMGASGGQDAVRILPSTAMSVIENYGGIPLPDQPSLIYRDGTLSLALPPQLIFEFPPLAQFLSFVTGDVLDETLAGAGVSFDQVDTTLVSGRGALWPGLREAVWARFPQRTRRTDLFEGAAARGMKEAVVRGAIAWQAIGEDVTFEAPREARLGALFSDHRLVPEEEWGNGVLKFGRSTWFKLVQVAHRAPSPKSDAKTLRRHFYVDLHPVRYRKDTYFKDGLVALERAETPHGPEIRILNGEGKVVCRANYQTSAGQDAIKAPWPIGQTLLAPEE